MSGDSRHLQNLSRCIRQITNQQRGYQVVLMINMKSIIKKFKCVFLNGAIFGDLRNKQIANTPNDENHKNIPKNTFGQNICDLSSN